MAKSRSCALPGKLTTRGRNRLPDRAFGLPSLRKYPMYRMVGGKAVPSRSHAANAKGRAATAYKRGQLTKRQYAQIVRKATRVLALCGARARKAKTKKMPAQKKSTAAEDRAKLRAWQKGQGKSP